VQAAAAIFKIDNLSTTLFKNDSSHDKLSRHGCDNKYESASQVCEKTLNCRGLKEKASVQNKNRWHCNDVTFEMCLLRGKLVLLISDWHAIAIF
jgi:hypothetical protein